MIPPPSKSDLTDKYKVRTFVSNAIGEEYLKPLFQVCDYFDEIKFDFLPDSFVIKCNHGCKWQFIIKDKKSYLENKNLFEYTKKQITNWMGMSFFGFSNFEIQYKNITPKILVEPLLRETPETFPREIEVLCFNGQPKIIETHRGLDTALVSVWDENFKSIDLKYTE